MSLRAALGLALGLGGCDPGAGVWGKGGSAGGDPDPGTTTGRDDDTADTAADDSATGSKEGTGYEAGDTAYDLQGEDQDGQDWSLWDQAGHPVVLVVGDLDFVTTTDTLGNLGALSTPDLVTVALIGRNAYSTAATDADADALADTYDLSAVLLDPDGGTLQTWSDHNPPKTYVIGPDLVIRWTGHDEATTDELSAALQD